MRSGPLSRGSRVKASRFRDPNDFAAALKAEPDPHRSQIAVIAREAGCSAPSSDWAFKLSPDSGRTAPQRPDNAYLLFKFALGKSIAELAADPAVWTWAEAANAQGPGQASADILAVIAAAQGQGGETPDPAYARFLETVSDPAWTGILALSVDVPLDSLPGPLQASRRNRSRLLLRPTISAFR